MADLVTIYLRGDPNLDPPFFWTVPADFDPDNNTVEMIGGGGRGMNNGGAGGAGGHYVKITNLALTPNTTVSYQLKSTENGSYSHTTDFDTWLVDDTTALAKAGPSATSATGAVSPDASESIGDVVYKGGNGGNGGGPGKGCGGGGTSGTPDGDGHDGGAADPDGHSGGGGASPTEDGADGDGDTGGEGGGGETPGGDGGTYPDDVDAKAGAHGATDEDGNAIWGFGSASGGAAVSSFSSLFSGEAAFPGDFGPGAGGGEGFRFGSRGIIKITYTPTDAGGGTKGAKVPPQLRRAEKPALFHLFEIDAAVVGSEPDDIRPVVTYAYGFGAAPFDAISLEATATVSRRTFGYADKGGYRSPVGDSFGEKKGLPRLVTPPSFNRALNLAPGDAAAGFTWGAGTMSRVSNDYSVYGNGPDFGINYYSTDAAPARMYIGLKVWDETRKIFIDPPIDDLMPVFSGVAQQWTIGRDLISVGIRDRLYLLDGPLQRVVYSGSGGLSGDSAVAGLPLPMVRGGTYDNPVRNVRLILVDAVNRIYQYNDAPGLVVTLYEGGVAGFTDQGDVDDLYAGSTDAGKYRTNNLRGLVQLGSDAVAEITADVTGVFSVADMDGDSIVAVTNPITIARRLMVESLGISPDYIDLVQFTAAEVQYDYTAGVYFDPEDNISAIDAISFLAGSIGARIGTSRDGLIRPFVIRIPSYLPNDIYKPEKITGITPLDLPSEMSPVVSRFRVRYAKNWRVQTSGLLESVTAAQRQYVGGNGPTASWADAWNLIKYPNAKDPAIVETALLIETEAQKVADAMGQFWGVPRRAYRLDLPLFALDRDLGDNIRFDEDLGIRPYPFYSFVYGITYTPGQATCSLMVIA